MVTSNPTIEFSVLCLLFIILYIKVMHSESPFGSHLTKPYVDDL